MLRTLLSRSLKLRVALYTLAIFWVGLGSLVWYARETVEAETLGLLSDQQFQSATIAAEGVEQDLQERWRAMQALALTLASVAERPAAELQAVLDTQSSLVSLFNAGAIITDAKGVVRASSPVTLMGAGADFHDRPHIRDALNGKPTNISSVLTGRLDGPLKSKPLISLAVPIWNQHGNVVGALVCAIDLGRPSFFDHVTGQQGRDLGSYVVLVDTRSRRILSSSNNTVERSELPAAGSNPAIDRFLDGFEGTQIRRNLAGETVLSSVRHVRGTGWLTAVSLPMTNILAPVRTVQRNTLLAGILISLVGGALTWVVLRREFRPLSRTVDTLTRHSAEPDSAPALEQLDVTRGDEIGRLVAGFNQLLKRLASRQQALQTSEARFRTTFRTLRDAIHVGRLSDNVCIDVNEGFERITGYAREELIGRPTQEFGIWRHAADRDHMVQLLLRDGFADALEAEFVCKDGSVRVGRMSVRLVELDGAPCALSVTHDITEQRQAEQQLRLAASVFRHAREGMIITDAQEIIVDVNEAFTRITGYAREEVVGKNPHLLRSRRHDRTFYVELWRAMREQGYWSGEIWNRRKNGEEYAERETVVAVSDEKNIVTHYIALFADITETQQLQEQVRQLAFFDPLTTLPNRRLFDDRLQQCMVATQRSGYCAALMLLDLDKFKQLNDEHGHLAGDALLVQIAQALNAQVRAVDTVARFGGDEFLILLQELHRDCELSCSEARRIAEKVRQTLARPFDLYVRREGRSGATHIVHEGSASIGAIVFCGHSMDAEQLLQHADAAMYRAKQQGGDAVVLHEDATVAAT